MVRSLTTAAVATVLMCTPAAACHHSEQLISQAQESDVYFRRKSNQPLINEKTSIDPENCTPNADGGFTCDTKVVNPDSPDNKYRN
ncbi:MAG TPA: hypothetical protein ACN46V_08250 [Prochlorococcus sp.]